MSELKRIPEIQTRLDHWAVWVQLHNSGGSCSSTLGYLIDMAAGRRVFGADDSHSCYVPIDDIECGKTEDAVNALPPDLKIAVHAWHRADGGTLDQVARQLKIVKTTLWRRLAQADRRIFDYLYK